MDRARRPTLAQAGVRLVALLLLLTCLFNVAISPASTALAAVCAGDEQILLAPEAPRVGSSLMVAAMSGFPHEDVLLLGPNGPIPVVRVAIGERFVWQEIVVVDRPGVNLFVFGVAGGTEPVTACADAATVVAEADLSPLFALLNSYGQSGTNAAGAEQPSDGADQPGSEGSPLDPEAGLSAPEEADAVETSDADDPSGAPQAASRRRPTRTPTPEPDNENGNDNTSEATRTPTRTPTSTRVPTATRTPRPTATDTPEPTATLAPASISSLSPSRPVCGQSLTIHGERFGSSRSVVDGQVYVDGRDASVESWSMTRIQVMVPLSARAGNDRRLEVVVSGRTVAKDAGLTC